MGGVTPRLIIAVLVAGIGSGFQHGYSTGVVNAPQHVVTRWLSSVYYKRSHDGHDLESCNYKTNGSNYSDTDGKHRKYKSPGRAQKRSHRTDCLDEDTYVYGNEHLVTLVWEIIVSVYCIGGIIGGLMTSCFASLIGRRNGLIVNNLFAIIAGILMYVSKMLSSPEVLILGRLLAGVNSGLNSGLCAMYLVEIATKALRGAVGSVYQLVVTIAILISQVLGLSELLGTDKCWPILFGLIVIVAILQAVLLPLLCPESPKFLYAKKGEEQSKIALQSLRKDDVDAEVEEIKGEYDKEVALGKTSCGQMFSEKILRTPLIISLLIMLAQQLSGINAVIYYSTQTFTKSGFSTRGAQMATIGMGAMNILMTVISLVLVDLAGRKTLLLTGFGSMFIVTCFLTVTLKLIDKASFLAAVCVILVILFVVCFATGPGSIPWFLVGEFFTQAARPKACSLAVSVNWMANFFVGLTFLSIQNMIGPFVFIIFAILQLIFLIYIFFKVPETKNKTYEEISEHFK